MTPNRTDRTDATYNALLRAVLADSADDVPRLVLADYLEEHAGEVECMACRGGKYCPKCSGEGCSGHSVAANGPCLAYDCPDCFGSGRVSNGFAEHSEFIRVQCELAFLASKAGGQHNESTPHYCIECGQMHALRKREREIWGSWPDVGDVRSYIHAQMPAVEGGWCILPESEASAGSGGRPFAIVSRGWVSSVHLTFAAFLGARCERCGGHGEVRDDWFVGDETRDTCPACRGTGCTGGCAAALFRALPIERVILTDREPLKFEGLYSWHNASHHLTSSEYDDERPADHLPGAVFSRLRGHVERPRRVTEVVKRYPTRDAALSACSAACVLFGRAAARLPELAGYNASDPGFA